MGASAIQWTDKVWNPIVGCSRVSPGCEHCYAERMARRLQGRFGYAQPWQPWTAPNAEHNVRLRPEALELPLHWRTPQRVFVNSMSDLFHEQVPDEFIERVFAVMAVAQQHSFQVLTKRPQRALQWFAGDVMESRANLVGSAAWQMKIGLFQGEPQPQYHHPSQCGLKGLYGADCRFCDPYYNVRRKWPGWPLPNVWVGVSVEDQRRADERLPILAQIPTAVRWVSCEPLLGPLDLERPMWDCVCGHIHGTNHDPCKWDVCTCQARERRIHWVVVGGESGLGARPCEVEWVRSTINQCKAAGVPVFIKQLGRYPVVRRVPDNLTGPEVLKAEHTIRAEWLTGVFFGNPTGQLELNGRVVHLRDSHGGDPAEWPADLQVREFPDV